MRQPQYKPEVDQRDTNAVGGSGKIRRAGRSKVLGPLLDFPISPIGRASNTRRDLRQVPAKTCRTPARKAVAVARYDEDDLIEHFSFPGANASGNPRQVPTVQAGGGYNRAEVY